MFGTTDLHYENVVAAGEFPIPIDIETLLHPQLGDSDEVTSLSKEGRIEFAKSVLSTGLLPTPFIPMDLDEKGVDLSGLSSVEGVETPFAVPVVENSGRSDMYVSSRRVPLHPAGNIPTCRGTRANFREYLDDVCTGFGSMYTQLLEHREEVIRSEIFNHGFSGLTVRVVPRATALYAQVLACLTHPDYGRDALDGERLLSYFRMYPLSKATLKMADCEIEQLSRGDIPMFMMKSDEDFVTDVGGSNICMVNVGCPLSTFKEKLATLSLKDLSRQLHYIEVSFYASDLGAHELYTLDSQGTKRRGLRLKDMDYSPIDEDNAPTLPSSKFQHKAVSIAATIGDHLISRSFKEECRAWVGLKLISDKHWRLEPIGLDLYSGLPGIGLFYYGLTRATSWERFEQAARTIAHAIATHWMEINERGLHGNYSPLDNGLYGSIGGSLYYLGKVCQWCEGTRILDGINALLSVSESTLERCDSADVVSGKAGLLQALSVLSRWCEDEHVFKRAQNLALRALYAIEAQAVEEDGGLGWVSPTEGRALLGYSHGASGIAAGLACGYAAFGSSFGQTPDVGRLISGAFGFEEAYYNKFGLWPDFRKDMVSSAGAGTWCHGGAGIVLARAVVDNVMDTLYSETTHYVESFTKLREEFARISLAESNLSLCHGLLGNLEVLRYSMRDVDMTIVRSAELAILDNIESNGISCGVPGGIELPGLMTGLSGIGLGLLGFADCSSVDLPLAGI